MAKVSKFGTFGGVFTPSILTILGVIMYLRLPMIIGEAGLWATLGIIAIAHIISVSTGLSVSSIATDKKVAAGGTYYMISRSLGLPIGGTLGLALFVGLSFSVSLYLIGFAESFLSYWEFDVTINTIRLAGTITLILVTTITMVSTSLAIKTQYLIMAAIVLSLGSIVFGSHSLGPADTAPALEPMSRAIPFMVLFGIFFPAVTGFEAGVSMSGDLADPKRSIPKGSIMAIVVGLVVYFALTFFFALTVDRVTLATDPQVLLKIAWQPELVIAGIWGATLSSALGSILGAPRILQATAVDNITPRFFSKGVGTANEPRNALLLTFLIAEGGILIGDLDVIARVVSIFFITTYGFLNLSCAFEAWTSADFRPSFKTPIWVSLLGAAACFIVMIELDFVATLGASIILGLLYFYLKRKELVLQSGDTWAGVWSSLAKTALHRLTMSRSHSRNWRPNILMFNGADRARPFMVQLGSAISGKLGLLTSFELTQSDVLIQPLKSAVAMDGEEKIFSNTYACPDIYTGIDEVARLYGYSGIQPNTVLMGWSVKPENKDKFTTLIKRIQQYNLNAVFLSHQPTTKKTPSPLIHVWWSGWGRNLTLALSLLRHLTSSDPWTLSQVRLYIIIDSEEDTEHIGRYIKNILLQYRLDATLKVIDNHFAKQPRNEIIAMESSDADLSIVGIPDSNYEDLEATYQFGCDLSHRLGSVVFINACDTFEEHAVISTASAERASREQQEWVLPEIPDTQVPEVIDDIRKIDAHGLQLTDLLHKKVFIAACKPESAIYEKLIPLAETTASALAKAMKHEQNYQRTSAMMRAKKHFNSRIAAFLDDTLQHVIRNQEDTVVEGMQWYLDQLATDSSRFPRHLTIQYPKSKFQPSTQDSAALRWYKFKCTLLHPFARRSIGLQVNYRAGASYFMRDLRYYFLTVLLHDLEKNLSICRENFRHFIAWADESFQLIIYEQDTSRRSELLTTFIMELPGRVAALNTQMQDLLSLYKGRLQVEYRKNVIFFMHQLESIDFNASVRRKRRHRKLYDTRRLMLSEFPARWSEQTTMDLTNIKSSALLYDYFGMVQQEIQGFVGRLKQFYAKEQEQPVQRVIDVLTEVSVAAPDSKPPALPDWVFPAESAMGPLRATANQLLALTRALPEESTMSVEFDGKAEGITLPLRAMASHLTETVLTGPITDSLEEWLAQVERSNLIINDQASLALFNVFNLEESDAEFVRETEINIAIKGIQQEVARLVLAFENTLKAIDRQCEELQGALKIHHLTDLSGDFSTLVRNSRQKRLQGHLSAKFLQVTDAIRKTLVSALYSQAKGVLLARQLYTGTQSLSVNERIMNLVLRVTPNQTVLQKLPHYYVSLFSGRSNIGDNFWVDRPDEEKQFASAFERYQMTRQGMILVLGERNTGKTALSKHFTESQAAYSSYHVFPPEGGSVDITEFDLALRKATKIDGDTAQILSLLPHNSIVVFHDLELWWERSPDEGLTVIRHLKSVIDTYAAKCLFLVNMNPFAFTTVNAAEPLDTHCAGVVRCLPFNSLELKKLIITRHKSSGLYLDFGSGVSETLGEIRLARIFNNLFSYSQGNPGVAMNAWLYGIQSFSDRVITWKTPVMKDQEVLAEMSGAWSHLCLQLLLHKRMSLEKITRTVQLETSTVLESLAVMKRLQLVSTRGNSIYYLNPGAEFLLIAYFREKEWI